jgi:hypothetical protein
VTYTSEQLAEALAAAARYGYRPPPLVYSSLRPYRPPVPPKPASTEIVRTPAYEASAAVEDKEPPADLPEVPVWLLRVDISVWRSRWFLRLVASFVVRRLGR